MFTLEQIDDIHDRLGQADTLPQYVRALQALGVARCDSYIADGHSEYVGENGHTVTSPPVHELLPIAETSNREQLLAHLDLHNQHKTSYLEMVKGLAASGIEKWTFDTHQMTIAYYDKAGHALVSEAILEDAEH